MKARRIIFLLTMVFLLMFTSLPHSGMKSLYAQDPPPPPVRCAVIFPVVFKSGLNFDTGFSLGGDSTSLGEGETPYVKLFFYDSTGNLIHEPDDPITFVKNGKNENSQWTWTLSELIIGGFSGFVVAITNIPHVEASCFIFDLNTGATSDAPAIIDYSITGIDENGQITRNAAYTPPQGWATLDPAEDEIDPTLHHTTLIFPYVSCVSAPPGLDTGIAITNTFKAGVTGRSVKFYLYESDGSLWGTLSATLSEGDEVSPMYAKFLSEILQLMTREQGQGDFSGHGFLIAHVNIPFAQGYSVLHYGGACFNAAAAAKVDNNIYDFSGGVPHRVCEPTIEHTSIVVPLISTVLTGQWTQVNLINTVQVLDEFYLPRNVTAHFYLYDMDGNLAVDWPETMTSSGELTEMLQVKFDVNGITINGELVDLSPFVFMGWLLIIVDAPGAEAMLTIGDATNALSMTRADVDNNIVSVTETGEDLGEIQRELYSPEAYEGDSWSIPFVTTMAGYHTYAVTVNTRNTSELSGDATFSYKWWPSSGEAPVSWETEVSAGGTLFPWYFEDVSETPRQSYQQNMAGRLVVTTNTSCTYGRAAYLTNDPPGDAKPDAVLLDAKDYKADILVDWNRDGEVKATEQDEWKGIRPGLILEKSNTTPIKLDFYTDPNNESFILDLPDDKSVIKVKIDGVEETGRVTGKRKGIQVTVESANANTGLVLISMMLENDPCTCSVLFVWVVPGGQNLAIVPNLEYMPTGIYHPLTAWRGMTRVWWCDWIITEDDGTSVYISGNMGEGEWWECADHVILYSGASPSANVDGVKIYAREVGSGQLPPGAPNAPPDDPEKEVLEEFTIFKLTIDNPVHGGGGLISDDANALNNYTGNEFTYSTASPGVLEIPVRLTILPNLADLRTAFADKVRIRISNINDSHTSPQGVNVQMAWDNPFVGEATAGKGVYDAADSLWKAKVTFTTLPPNNSDFGSKWVIVDVRFVTVHMVSLVNIEVFWPLLREAGLRNEANFAKNHPGIDEEGSPYLAATADETGAAAGPRCPNWFYYWRQVIPGGEWSRYAGTQMGGVFGRCPAMFYYSVYRGIIGRIVIRYVAQDDDDDPDEDGPRQRTTGIDTFRDTVIHENYHSVQQCVRYTNEAFWMLGVNVSSNSNNGPICWSFNIAQGAAGYNHYYLLADLDADGDDVPDWSDPEPLIPNSTAPRLELEQPAWDAEPDQQDGIKDLDWGNPGKNHGSNAYDD